MFCDMYMPHLSGVTNHIRLYKRRFEELGHEVYVFTYGNRDHEDDEPNVVRSPAIAWGKTGWQAGLGLSGEAAELMPTLDIAHVHHPFLSGRVALRQCGARGIPVVSTNHTRYDLYSDTYASFLPRRLRMAYLRTYLSRYASDVDVVIAPSPGVKDWLCEFGITCEAVLVPNSIDTQPFMNPRRPEDKHRFGFEQDAVVFCYLGRLGEEKNLGMLIDAFVKAAERDDRVCLLLIGDGPGRKMATERVWAHGVNERVHFAGLIPYTEVPNVLCAADVFVSASVSEVHPLVVMEGMAAGLPAIGVESPGVGDIVGDGVTGYLVSEDSAEFAERMLELARDEELLSTMSAAARNEAAGYDIRILGDEMLERYTALIG
jgi:glycosyltransferase involved in cell wall biosynthesis